MRKVIEVTKALGYHIVAFKMHVCRMLVRANLKGRADFKALCNFTARGMAHALSYRAQGGFTNLTSRGDYTASLDIGFGFGLFGLLKLLLRLLNISIIRSVTGSSREHRIAITLTR